MGNHRLQRGGPIGEHNDSKVTSITIRQPHNYGNANVSRPHTNKLPTPITHQDRPRKCRPVHEEPNSQQVVCATTQDAPTPAADPTANEPTIRRLTPQCTNHPTINRPHASRPTPYQPDMQGSKRERRPTGWRHHGAQRAQTTIPTDTTEHRNSAIMQPTNQRQRTTSIPRPPGRAQVRPSQEA